MDVRKSIDFVIDKSKQTIVRANIARIQHLFCVDVQLVEVAHTADALQWINVTGQNDTSLTDAKTYITAMTNAEKIVAVKNMHSCSLFNSNAREDIERKSCAFLSFEMNGNLLVKGTELSVVMAASLLEELLKTEKKGRKEIDDCFITDVQQAEIRQRDSPAASGSNVASSQQFSETSETTSTRRPLSSCNLNTSKDSYAAALLYHKGHGISPPSNASQLHNSSKAVPVSHSGNETTCTVNSSTSNQKIVGNCANGDFVRFCETQRDYLRNVGLSSNYRSEDIEAGLASFDMNDVVRPVDFLNKLKENSKTQHGVIPKGFPDCSTQPASSETSSAAAAQERMDLDQSVIYLGSSPDAITISSDEEDVTVIGTEEKTSVDRTISGPEKVALSSQARTSSEYQPSNLRYIVIDGSNVAMAHGQNKVFSVKGIEICMDFFLSRGHQVMAFVPEWRRYSKNQSVIPITNKNLLEKLNEEGFLKFTPARRLDGGKCIASYDDRYILNLAVKENGIVVSNDYFRDLVAEKACYREVVENRLLPCVFVNDHFMPPDDPLGRDGPPLEEFLQLPKKKKPCVGSARSTGGNRVRMAAGNGQMGPGFQREGPTLPHQFMGPRPQGHDDCSSDRNLALTQQLLQDLCQVFPEPHQRKKIETILKNHPKEIDLNRLTNYCMSAIFP